MTGIKKKIYDIAGCTRRFYGYELAILCQFFNCKSSDELALAAQRYEHLLVSRELFPGDDNFLVALSLASELYINFQSLENPLELRHPPKRNGQAARERKFPSNILQIMQDEKQKISWQKKPTQKEIIKHLQDAGKLPSNIKTSTLEKDIQELKRRQAELENDFKDIVLTNDFAATSK